MRLEYVALLDGWKLEGLDVGGRSYQRTDPDLRTLHLPLVHIVFRVTLRARNTSAEKQRFPGAKIIGDGGSATPGSHSPGSRASRPREHLAPRALPRRTLAPALHRHAARNSPQACRC